jgi:hypothetical protein
VEGRKLEVWAEIMPESLRGIARWRRSRESLLQRKVGVTGALEAGAWHGRDMALFHSI